MAPICGRGTISRLFSIADDLRPSDKTEPCPCAHVTSIFSPWYGAVISPLGWLFVVSVESIADQRFGKDVAGFVWGRLDLSAQMANQDPQGLSIARMLRPPENVKQFQVRYWFSATEDQLLKEFKFFWCEMYSFSAREDATALEVNLYIRRNERRDFFCFGRFSGGCSHPG